MKRIRRALPSLAIGTLAAFAARLASPPAGRSPIENLWRGDLLDTPWAVTVLALAIAGILAGVWFRRPVLETGLAVGCGVVLWLLVRMAIEGAGNLWPLALAFALALGALPAIAGAWLGREFRRREG